MRKATIGHTGIEVPGLCLGGNVFGWTVAEAQAFDLLDRAFDVGLTFIDTADSYSHWVPGNSGGESETIIGRWLKRSGKRDRVVIATKVGHDIGECKGRLTRQHIARSIEGSLRRLGTDRVDLYYSHSDDPQTPMEETLGAYAGLIEQGKVRAVGASNFSATRLRQALDLSDRTGLPRYEALQPLYNLYSRDEYEGELEALAEGEDISVFPYYALARGFLTGKYRSDADLARSRRGDGNEHYLNQRGLRILAAMDEVAAASGATLAEVAIAWLIARPGVTAPIASATSAQQLASLVRALSLHLDAAAMEQLNEASKAMLAG